MVAYDVSIERERERMDIIEDDERMAIIVDDDAVDDLRDVMPLLVTFVVAFVTSYVVFVRICGWTLKRGNGSEREGGREGGRGGGGRGSGGGSGGSGECIVRPDPPSMSSLPIVGSLVFMTSCRGLFHRFFAEKAKTLGPVFTCYLGSKLTLVLNDRRTIDEALIRKSAFFSGRTLFYATKVFFNPKAKGIIYRQYNNGDFRRYHQHALTTLKEFGLGQNEMERRIHREIDELIDLIDSKQGQPFDPADLLSLCTLNVVTSLLFAERLKQTDPGLRRMKDIIHEFIHSIRFYVAFCPFLRFIPPFKESIKHGSRLIEESHQYIGKGIKRSLEMEKTVSSYVASFVSKEKESGTYDEEDLLFACRDLMEAGSDTTATTILWSMEMMANHPDIQKRIHEDIDAQLGAHHHQHQQQHQQHQHQQQQQYQQQHQQQQYYRPTSSDAIRLPYVEATILEVLRLRTVLPLSLPHKVVEDTTIAGYNVKKETMVLLNLYAVHMDVETWKDPEVFRPDRFLDESGQKVVGRNRIIPFSIGRRSCLGEGIARQELFLIFTSLLQRFEILPPEGQKKVVCQPTPATIVSPSPFKVRLIPRNNRQS